MSRESCFIWAVKGGNTETLGERAKGQSSPTERGQRAVQCSRAIFLLILAWHKLASGP